MPPKNEQSLSQLKQRIRSIKRLLNKEGLSPEIHAAKSKELEELETQIQEPGAVAKAPKKTKIKKEPDYKKIRFTELTKAQRKLSQAEKKQDDALITKCKEDLLYVYFFPLGKQKYISLYPPKPMEDPVTIELQKTIRDAILSTYTFEDIESDKEKRNEKYQLMLERRKDRNEKTEKIRLARLEKKRKRKEEVFEEDDDFFVDREPTEEERKAFEEEKENGRKKKLEEKKAPLLKKHKSIEPIKGDGLLRFDDENVPVDAYKPIEFEEDDQSKEDVESSQSEKSSDTEDEDNINEVSGESESSDLGEASQESNDGSSSSS